MSFLLRVFVGLLVSATGLLFVFKTPWILSMVGRIEFAEKYFGPGGTRLFYKLFGTLVIMIGFMIITNLFGRVIAEPFANLFSV